MDTQRVIIFPADTNYIGGGLIAVSYGPVEALPGGTLREEAVAATERAISARDIAQPGVYFVNTIYQDRSAHLVRVVVEHGGLTARASD